MEIYGSPIEAIIAIVVTLGGAIGFAIKRMFGAQAEKIRAEAAASAEKVKAEATTMIEESERKSRQQAAEMTLKLKEFELERDAQRAMNSLVERLLGQVAQSNQSMTQALAKIGVVSEKANQVIADNNAHLSENVTSSKGLKDSVDQLQVAILALPDTLQQQNAVQNELQTQNINIMVDAVTTLKNAVEAFIQNQTASDNPPKNGNLPESASIPDEAVPRRVVVKEEIDKAAKEAVTNHDRENDAKVGSGAARAGNPVPAGSPVAGPGSGS